MKNVTRNFLTWAQLVSIPHAYVNAAREVYAPITRDGKTIGQLFHGLVTEDMRREFARREHMRRVAYSIGAARARCADETWKAEHAEDCAQVELA